MVLDNPCESLLTSKGVSTHRFRDSAIEINWLQKNIVPCPSCHPSRLLRFWGSTLRLLLGYSCLWTQQGGQSLQNRCLPGKQETSTFPTDPGLREDTVPWTKASQGQSALFQVTVIGNASKVLLDQTISPFLSFFSHIKDMFLLKISFWSFYKMIQHQFKFLFSGSTTRQR